MDTLRFHQVRCAAAAPGYETFRTEGCRDRKANAERNERMNETCHVDEGTRNGWMV